MSLRYYIIIFVGLLTFGCSEQEPNSFENSHFVRFKFDSQSKDYYKLSYNFAFASDTATKYEFVFPVEIMGRDFTENLYFGVVADSKGTTLPSDCYGLINEQPFRSGIGSVDTMRVMLFRKSILKEEERVLRLQLVNTNDFQFYMPDSCYIELTVSDIFSRPEWWDESVQNAYLGKYSKTKYDEFIKETKIYDFGVLDPSEKRYYAIMFKRALEKTPRPDEDGSIMTVTIPG